MTMEKGTVANQTHFHGFAFWQGYLSEIIRKGTVATQNRGKGDVARVQVFEIRPFSSRGTVATYIYICGNCHGCHGFPKPKIQKGHTMSSPTVLIEVHPTTGEVVSAQIQAMTDVQEDVCRKALEPLLGRPNPRDLLRVVAGGRKGPRE